MKVALFFECTEVGIQLPCRGYVDLLRTKGQWGKMHGQKSFETSKFLQIQQSQSIGSLTHYSAIYYEVFKDLLRLKF